MDCTPAQERESAGALLARLGTDAEAWAREFAGTLTRLANERHDQSGEPWKVAAGEIATEDAPGDWLHGWLCNAIEAGRSAGYGLGRQHAADAVSTRAAESGTPALIADQLRAAALGGYGPAGVWAPYRQDSPVGVPATAAGRARTVPAESAGRTADDYRREFLDLGRRQLAALDRIGDELRRQRVDRERAKL